MKLNLQHHRHVTKLAKTPPRTGPIPPANAQMPSVNPISRLRCLRLNKSLMQTWTSKIDPPPAQPWKALPMISSCIVFAVAHTAELIKNIASATSMIILRPQISENLAHIGPEAAVASKYAPPIHVYPAALLRSRDMVGAAVATTVASRAATNSESYTTVSISAT